jgi:thiol-disulfide isomerase/thioredoxin
MFRKLLAGAFFLLITVITIWLIYLIFQPEKMSIGTRLPDFAYQTETGFNEFIPDSALNTIIVHFHSECKYCRYQLQLFDENLSVLQGTKIILLTFEKIFFDKMIMTEWPSLAVSSNVVWGIVEEDEFAKWFGSKTTPTTYIFDRRATLCAKIIGEVKLDRIITELNKLGGPEHRVSGN